MSTCLGMYIEQNIIKYAKVTKDHDQIKVESYGVKFFDDLNQAINQVVEETYSYKIPISVNLSGEIYNYFQVFTLLSKNDLPKAIKTEFEAYCADHNYNANAFETRYAITPNTQDKEKLKVIHISENKIELNKILQRFNSYKLQNIVPVSMSIPNIAKFDDKENCLIVNIEEKTTITSIINQNIYDIKTLDIGSQDILEKINLKVNSLQKAYETCKETTIYTSEGRELSDIETGYLEDIMPTLYDIVGNLRKIINESLDKIEKIYITGTGALINNIDLYFEEYLENVKCEILKPDFIKISPSINIKDYVEVNSAISIALSGLGRGVAGINFKKTSFMDKLPDILTMEIGGKNKKNSDKRSINIKADWLVMDFNVPLDKIEQRLLRGVAGLLILLVVFCCFSTMIKKQIEDKKNQANDSINNTNAQIALVEKDIVNVQNKTKEYKKLNEEYEQKNKDLLNKNAIPNLLHKLIYNIPSEVQLVSVENTTGKHIVIQAQSQSYANLGYLISAIKNNNILVNATPTAGYKEKGKSNVVITIEGDLP